MKNKINALQRGESSGFTIVELLIVIVVIGILAAISIVAFQNIQQRARDSQRIQDMKTIEKALRLHLAEHGSLPAANGSRPTSWELSTQNGGSSFISGLVSSGTVSKVPVDPRNNSSMHYRYFKFAAGTASCNSSRGDFAVLQVISMESTSGAHPQDPKFRCPLLNWPQEANYTLGIFENG